MTTSENQPPSESTGAQFRSLEDYHNKASFTDFSDFTKAQNFTPVPESWLVIITDIKGSTKAIENGRYQDVNMIGAASISVLQELLKRDFPFVFGGDGATIVLPSSHSTEVFKALCGLRTLSKNRFGMVLRVGCVPVKEIYDRGGRIEFAKHELSASKCIAIFRGGGLNIAEDLIKGDEEKYEVPFQDSPAATFQGLTCNWQPIAAQRGVMLSLLVLSKTGDAVYEAFVDFLDEVFDGNLNSANPVNVAQLKMKSIGSIVKNHVHTSPRYFSRSLLNNLYSSMKFRLSEWIPLPNIGTHKEGRLGEYIPTMQTHADYRKFDDVLRMVLDCSEQQFQAIEQYLASKYEEGQLFYGMYRSETALMTCYVQDIEPGQHIHFIDGGSGGYAMAAKQLKAQLKNS